MKYAELVGVSDVPWTKGEKQRLLSYFTRLEGAGPRAQGRARSRRNEALKLEGFDRRMMRARIVP